MKRSLRTKIRTVFIAGLLVTMPLTFTVWVLVFLFQRLDRLLAPWVYRILATYGFSLSDGISLPGVGIVATLLIIFGVGLFTTSFIGRRIIHLGESIVDRIPFVRVIYSAVKQFLEAITFSERGTFRQVVMIEYPRKGLWTLGFLTTEASGEVQEKMDEYIVYVFLPTTPNPTSGWLVATPMKDVTPLSMTVEEGIKLIVSGGILSPRQRPENAVDVAEAASQSLFIAERKES